MIPAFDPVTGGLPPGDRQATLEEIARHLGFTPRRRWLLKGLRTAVGAFWAAGIEEIYIDGSFCTKKPDPGDIDGYWIEPYPGVYERIDPYLDRLRPGAGAIRSKVEVAHVDRVRRRVPPA